MSFFRRNIAFGVLLSFVAANAYSSTSKNLEGLLSEAKEAIATPEEYPVIAQKIQDFFSNPANKTLLTSSGAKELSQIQTKFINFMRLSDVLTGLACNIDRTQQSALGKEILLGSMAQPLCQNWEGSFLQEHKKLSSLMDEIKIIEEKSYSGSYAVDKNGDLIFPWETSKEQKASYDWKTNTPEVRITDKAEAQKDLPAKAGPEVFDPLSINSNQELRDELFKQSLKNTLNTFIYLQESYGNEKVDPGYLAVKFCRERKTWFSRLTRQKKKGKCPDSVFQYLTNLSAASERSRPSVSYADGAKELNERIKKLNEITATIKSNTTPTYDTEMLRKTGKQIVTGAKFKDKVQAEKDYQNYQKLHAEMSASGPGLFMATDALQRKLGLKAFEPTQFLDEHPQIDATLFKAAVNEAKGHTMDHAQELISIYHSDEKPAEQVEELIQLNPAAVSYVLMNRPELSRTACQGLKGISTEEMNDNQLRLLTTWGGAVVGGSLAITGYGAAFIPALSAIAAGSPRVYHAYQDYQRAAIRANAAISERDSARANKEYLKSKEAHKDFKTESAFLAFGVFSDVNGMLRTGNAVKNSSAYKQALQKLTKQWVNSIKLATKRRENMLISAYNGMKFKLGKQVAKGSQGVVSDLDGFSNIPSLDPKGEYVTKLAHTLEGSDKPLASAVRSMEREFEIYDDVGKSWTEIKTSKHYPNDPAWGDSTPLSKIHVNVKTDKGPLFVKDKIKGLSMDQYLERHGGTLPPEGKKALKDIYDLNQALYEKKKIVVDGVEGAFSGDIAKGNVMWIEDAKTLKQLGYKEPGFILLELDVHYKNGTRFIEGTMNFKEYMKYMITN